MTLSATPIEALETALSEPTPGAIESMGRIDGDILLLGVAGKMGPSLARMAKRASELAGKKRRVMGVSRFSSPGSEADLQAHGIETIKCDLLDEQAIQNLPEAPNVIHLAGMKFGSTGQEPLTWAMNTYLPALVFKKFSRSRIVVLSTGNVYGLVPADGNGSDEADLPSPTGEYAMSCLGRERMVQHFSRTMGIPSVLVRLNYACDLRYGVLVDLAQQVLNGRPVDLAMGWFNTIWQGDANAMILQSIEHASVPPLLLNLTGPEKLNVRETCGEFAKKFGRPVTFCQAEKPTALLSDARRAFELFGKPRVTAEELIERVADWIQRDGPTLGKLTHFESRDGKF